MKRLLSVTALLFAFSVPAYAEVVRYGPFTVDSETPHIIRLSGEIDLTSAEAFRSAVADFPDLAVLTLESNGGATFIAAAIASEVSRHGIATAVLGGYGCFSACPLIFFAGSSRLAIGPLGVHQVSFPRAQQVTPQEAQAGVARYIEVLVGLGIHPEVIRVALDTPPTAMYIFTRAEIETFGIEHEPDHVLDLLGPDPDVGPDRAALVARLNEQVELALEDDDALRDIAEAASGPLPDATWRALATLQRATLLHPDFGNYLMDVMAAMGLDPAVAPDQIAGAIVEPTTDAELAIATIMSDIATRGVLRLSPADLDSLLAYSRDLLAWLPSHRPQACTDQVALFDATLSAEYLASVELGQLKNFIGLVMRGADAELSGRSPQTTPSGVDLIAVESHFTEAVMRIAAEHPRGSELLAPDPAEPTDFCLAAELGLAAVDSMPSDLRADAIIYLFAAAQF